MQDDPAFQRFREVQLPWDRAMAEGLASAHKRTGALAVGIISGGHLEDRHGVPHQLNALGIPDSVVLLPWAANRPCADLKPSLADAVFGVAADPETEQSTWRPRLGVSLAPWTKDRIRRQRQRCGGGGVAHRRHHSGGSRDPHQRGRQAGRNRQPASAGDMAAAERAAGGFDARGRREVPQFVTIDWKN